MATATRKTVGPTRKSPAAKPPVKAAVKARVAKQIQGIPEEAAAYAPWWLMYGGVIVATSIFSSVLFDYVKKHESTADRYEVKKNPAFAK